MRYVAGIDGGQSSTTAAIVDETGAVVGRGTAGPADHVDEGPGSARCADACTAAFAAALESAGLSPLTRVEAVVAGISGYDDTFDGAVPALAADRFRFVHDLPIALAGAVPFRPAVLLLSGTGSAAYGEDEQGRGVSSGGWGYLFGDEGSAFAIARDALAAAMRADDRGELVALTQPALDFFAVVGMRALASAALRGRISRTRVASFAPRVHDAAAAGDADGLRIIADAADALASLAALTIARLDRAGEAVAVVLAGGSFENSAFASLVGTRLHAHAPHAAVLRPQHTAAVGAALLAFDDAGLARPSVVTG
jgi:N-acetylglucosamine kinase-like BadF-type ATPase